MVTTRPSLVLLFGLANCGIPEVRPPTGGVSGVLLEVRSDTSRTVEAREQTNQRLNYESGEQVLLHDLGRPLADFQLQPGPVSLGGSRRLAPVASYLYDDGVWSATATSQDLMVQPFDPTLCPTCVDSLACPACSESSNRTPVCTECSTPNFLPQPPDLRFDCPVNWIETMDAAGVRWCAPQLPAMAETECPAHERFDWAGRCVAVNADCEEPQPRPGRKFLYVEPGAAAGGDGSRASPLPTILNQEDTDYLVLAGDLTGPIVLADNVAVIGSGTCSRIFAPGDDVALRTNESALIARLRIERADLERDSDGSLIISTASITIDQAELNAGAGGALRLSGNSIVRRSLILSKRTCAEANCNNFALYSNGGDLEIVDTDIVAPTALQKNQGGVNITRVRVRGDSSPFSRGVGVLNASPVVVSGLIVSRSNFRGLSVSATDTSTSARLHLDGVHVSGRTQTPQRRSERNRSVGIRLAFVGASPDRAQVLRSSARGYEVGIHSIAVPLELQGFNTTQVLESVFTNINALFQTRLSFTDLWLEYAGDDGINIASENGVVLDIERAVITKDCSISDCPAPSVQSNHAPITVSFYRASSILSARQVVLRPGNGHATVGFESLTLDDVLVDGPRFELFFSALDFGLFRHTLNRVHLKNLQGARFRWFDQANLTDVHIDGTAPLVCMLGPANGVAQGILLRASGDQPVIVVADTDDGTVRPRLERGRIEHQGNVLGASIDQDCELIDTRTEATVLSDIEIVDARP